MKMLLIPTFYNIVLSVLTAFLVAAVLSPQESVAFEHDVGSSSSSETYHIPLTHGAVVVSTLLQFRGGSKNGNLNHIIANDDDSDGDGDHTYTNIAGITMDNSFRGGGEHQHRDTSTIIASRHSGGFVPQKSLVGRLPRRRRLRDVRSNVNQALNNYLVRFYWSQVTKGCSLHIPDLSNNSRNTDDALLAVQVRGGADNNNKNNNQNVSPVDEFTKGVLKILKNKFLMIVATGIVLYTCIPYPVKSAAASPALCIACGILVAEICTSSNK